MAKNGKTLPHPSHLIKNPETLRDRERNINLSAEQQGAIVDCTIEANL